MKRKLVGTKFVSVMDCDPPDHFQMPNPMIQLQSSDGEIFQVEVKVARLSLHLKQMMDDLGIEENELISIPQNGPKISGAILGKILQWGSQHKDDPAVAEDDKNKVKPTDDISSLDAEFLEIDQTTLFQMIRAANYLNIKGLVDVTCKKVAKSMKGMTLEEVRQTFCIHNDFTPDEEEQVCKENAWYEGFRFGANRRPVSGNLLNKAPTDSVHDVDKDGGQFNETCLNNSLVVREILEYLSDLELVVFSRLNKMWNYEARSFMRQWRNIVANVNSHGSCQAVQAFAEDLQQMNIVPFCGMRIVLPDGDDSCQCAMSFLDPTDDIIFDPLPFKTLSVELGGKRWDNQSCRGFLLATQILQVSSVVIEELLLLMSSNPESFIQHYVQECNFPRLKILKLEETRSCSLNREGYLMYFKALMSRAPNLRKVHSDRPIPVLLRLVEGSSVVPVCTYQVCAPFNEISDDVINSELRLQRMKLVCTTPVCTFDSERFNRIAPMLLETSGSSTLRDLTVDSALAAPLVCYGVCLENVSKLTMGMDYLRLDRNHLQLDLIFRILKNFNFTRVFPNLTKVRITLEAISNRLPESLNRFIRQANDDLREPAADRAVNIKELHVHDRDRAFDSKNVPFFAQMFPNIESLHVESFGEKVVLNFESICEQWVNLKELHIRSTVLKDNVPFFAQMFPNIDRLYVKGSGGEADFIFESICQYWVNLKELHIKSKALKDTANFDCTLCGIFFDEVVQLMQRDDAYLKSINIVPVKPSVTCLRNLRVLNMEYDLEQRPDPVVFDATNPMFFLSKITGLTAFARCPNLAVTLKISPGGAHAVNHLKPYLLIDLYG